MFLPVWDPCSLSSLTALGRSLCQEAISRPGGGGGAPDSYFNQVITPRGRNQAVKS